MSILRRSNSRFFFVEFVGTSVEGLKNSSFRLINDKSSSGVGVKGVGASGENEAAGITSSWVRLGEIFFYSSIPADKSNTL